MLGGAVLIENRGGTGRAVIVCDHASNLVPRRFGTLGLEQSDLTRHIAWDPGALGVSRVLSRRLDAPLIAGGVSRLVIDCNRDPAMLDAIPAVSEETGVPGNVEVGTADRAWRIERVYRPYHAAIDDVLDDKATTGPVAVIGVHTFTPLYKGRERPWHVGILFDRDRRLSKPMIAVLSAQKDLVLGVNEPYSPDDRVYHTLDRHAQARGWPNVMIEIRNDLVASPEAEAVWGEKLARVIAGALDGALDTEPDTPAA